MTRDEIDEVMDREWDCYQCHVRQGLLVLCDGDRDKYNEMLLELVTKLKEKQNG